MMQKRRKQIIDGIDREIVRSLYDYGPLVSSKVAKIVGLSASAIFPRLFNLKERGIIKQSSHLANRIYNRNFGKRIVRIVSSRGIFWEIDLEESSK